MHWSEERVLPSLEDDTRQPSEIPIYFQELFWPGDGNVRRARRHRRHRELPVDVLERFRELHVPFVCELPETEADRKRDS